jgi:hypothetical protein
MCSSLIKVSWLLLQYTKFEDALIHLSMMDVKNYLSVFIMIGNVWFINFCIEYAEIVNWSNMLYFSHNRLLNNELQ